VPAAIQLPYKIKENIINTKKPGGELENAKKD